MGPYRDDAHPNWHGMYISQVGFPLHVCPKGVIASISAIASENTKVAATDLDFVRAASRYGKRVLPGTRDLRRGYLTSGSSRRIDAQRAALLPSRGGRILAGRTRHDEFLRRRGPVKRSTLPGVSVAGEDFRIAERVRRQRAADRWACYVAMNTRQGRAFWPRRAAFSGFIDMARPRWTTLRVIGSTLIPGEITRNSARRAKHKPGTNRQPQNRLEDPHRQNRHFDPGPLNHTSTADSGTARQAHRRSAPRADLEPVLPSVHPAGPAAGAFLAGPAGSTWNCDLHPE